LHFWDDNHGLSRITENINLVLEQYPWAIFVEDDCLPVPGFYEFLRAALERYRDEPRVFSIGGYQPVPSKTFPNYPCSLVSSARFICWGWATWRDRWQIIPANLEHYVSYFDHLSKVQDTAGPDLPLMAQGIANGSLPASWDIPVSLIALHFNQVHLLPAKGLIKNIGLGRGVHTRAANLLRSWLTHNRNVASSAPEIPVWLEDVSPNEKYSAALTFNQFRNTLTHIFRSQA
jgi:hypothetical protein